VFLLTDGYLANAAEPWLLPDMKNYAPIVTNKIGTDGKAAIFERDPKSLGRPWVAPGTPGLLHRIGGLEKDIRTGNISYEPDNHQAMTELRANKVRSVAEFIPDQRVAIGPEHGAIAVVGWGSTYGSIYQAVRRIARKHKNVSHIHVRYLNPFPKNLGALLSGFDRIVVPEMNMGQFATLLRDKLGIEVIQYNKVTGQPFQIRELVKFIETQLPSRGNVEALPRVRHGDRA